MAAPDNHLSAGPHCRVTDSSNGREVHARGYPTVHAGVVPSSGPNAAAKSNTTPDNHFTTGPYRRVKRSGGWSVDKAGSYPTIHCWIISPTGIQIGIAPPDDHLIASPHCRVIRSASRYVNNAGGCPPVRSGTIPAAGVQITAIVAVKSAPNDHFTACPHCCMQRSAFRCVDGA